MTKRYFWIWGLCLSLALGACRQDDFDPISEDPTERIDKGTARLTPELEHIKELYHQVYDADKARALEQVGALDFETLKPLWEYSLKDTLPGNLEVTATLIELSNYSLPASQTFSREDVERFKGIITFPRLYHYRNLSSAKEWFRIVIIQPTKDWCDSHNPLEIFRSVTVPKGFEGMLDVYDLDKKPLQRFVYQDGKARATYRAGKAQKQDEARNFITNDCDYRLLGYYWVQYSKREWTEITYPDLNYEFKGFLNTIVAERKDLFGWYCKEVSTTTLNWYMATMPPPTPTELYGHPDDDCFYPGQPDLGSVGGVDPTYDYQPQPQPEDPQKVRERKLKEDCNKMKQILDPNTQLGQHISQIKQFRDNTPSHLTHEQGYVELSNGRFIALKPKGQHSVDLNGAEPTAEERANGVRVKGHLHNHPKDTYHPNGNIVHSIQIFSPTDVHEFFDMLRKTASSSSGAKPEDLYSVLVADTYIYKLSINTSREDIQHVMFLAGRKRDLEKIYRKYLGNPHTSVVDLYSQFVSFLTEAYPIEGLTIQRIDPKTNDVESVTLQQTDDKSKANYADDKYKPTIQTLNSNC